MSTLCNVLERFITYFCIYFNNVHLPFSTSQRNISLNFFLRTTCYQSIYVFDLEI